jgi:large subunit ribosomal protein L17
VRHRVYGKHLSRTKNQRTALFRSLVGSLIQSEKIQTTEAKAKAVKPLIDKLITQAKSKSAQRHVFEFFPQKVVAQKLVDDIAPRTGNRTSGYTSTVRTGSRQGDGAMMVSISLLLEEKKAVKATATKEAKTTEKEEVNADVITEKPVKKAAVKKGNKK